jgi:hypothetical protein
VGLISELPDGAHEVQGKMSYLIKLQGSTLTFVHCFNFTDSRDVVIEFLNGLRSLQWFAIYHNSCMGDTRNESKSKKTLASQQAKRALKSFLEVTHAYDNP